MLNHNWSLREDGVYKKKICIQTLKTDYDIFSVFQKTDKILLNYSPYFSNII